MKCLESWVIANTFIVPVYGKKFRLKIMNNNGGCSRIPIVPNSEYFQRFGADLRWFAGVCHFVVAWVAGFPLGLAM